MKLRLVLPILLLGAAFGPLGCSSATADATPEQTKAFKGGPPPPDIQQRIAAAQASAQAAGNEARNKRK